MSAEKELRRPQESDYQQENQNPQHEVKKWSQYCAYVAGVGIILFLLVFASAEPEVVECPECEECTICEECEVCPEPTVCPEPIECLKLKHPSQNPKDNCQRS